MDDYKTMEDFERELNEMRLKFLELKACRLDVQTVQKRYEQLLQSAPDAMIFVNREAKIVRINAQLGSLFGYTEEELIGRDLDTLIPVRYRLRHRENVARYFAQPRIRPMGTGLVIYGLRKDGIEFPADISLSPLETDGEKLAVGAVRDITERKRAEEEKQRLREQLAQVETASALGRIAANVADEIRNPLTAIGGFARRLQKIADSEREREYAAYVVSEVDRLEGLLRGVLAFSRSRSPLLEDHTIRKILDGALKVWGEKFRQHSITVHKEYREDALVRVDQAQVREAVECLVANAVEAMPGGGTLSVETDREIVNGVPYVRIKIQDTGEGIDAEKLGKIFEPFFTTKMSPKGAGLGLPIAKKIIEEEGGTINLDSTKGTGTTATILFPDVRT
ncbi:MAG TPA: PAS domain S-box protein [Thermodesulfovibrionales bacterium]|nr:PAS domain S-box protein [Thermodesulfovibrionales bacterium]